MRRVCPSPSGRGGQNSEPSCSQGGEDLVTPCRLSKRGSRLGERCDEGESGLVRSRPASENDSRGERVHRCKGLEPAAGLVPPASTESNDNLCHPFPPTWSTSPLQVWGSSVARISRDKSSAKGFDRMVVPQRGGTNVAESAPIDNCGYCILILSNVPDLEPSLSLTTDSIVGPRLQLLARRAHRHDWVRQEPDG